MNKIPAAAETVESSESEEECDSDEGDEVGQVISNVTRMESVLATHRIACIGQKFTRLPCAAHKVMPNSFSKYLCYSNHYLVGSFSGR